MYLNKSRIINCMKHRSNASVMRELRKDDMEHLSFVILSGNSLSNYLSVHIFLACLPVICPLPHSVLTGTDQCTLTIIYFFNCL